MTKEYEQCCIDLNRLDIMVPMYVNWHWPSTPRMNMNNYRNGAVGPRIITELLVIVTWRIDFTTKKEF